MSSKIILITGANSGVGYAITKVIAQSSSDYHIIMAGRSVEKVESAKAEIEALGIKGQLSTVQLDVISESSIQQAADVIEKQHGRLDVLINNAGVANMDDNPRTRLQQCLETNVIGPVLVSGAFKPLLFKSSAPVSIYVTSVVGSLTSAADPSSPWYKGLKNGEAYRASKAALNMVMLQEWADLKDTGLKIFAMCPGYVRSNLRGTSEEQRSGWGRAGDPDESGRIALSIVEGKRDADVAKFISGGGLSAW